MIVCNKIVLRLISIVVINSMSMYGMQDKENKEVLLPIFYQANFDESVATIGSDKNGKIDSYVQPDKFHRIVKKNGITYIIPNEIGRNHFVIDDKNSRVFCAGCYSGWKIYCFDNIVPDENKNYTFVKYNENNIRNNQLGGPKFIFDIDPDIKNIHVDKIDTNGTHMAIVTSNHQDENLHLYEIKACDETNKFDEQVSLTLKEIAKTKSWGKTNNLTLGKNAFAITSDNKRVLVVPIKKDAFENISIENILYTAKEDELIGNIQYVSESEKIIVNLFSSKKNQTYFDNTQLLKKIIIINTQNKNVMYQLELPNIPLNTTHQQLLVTEKKIGFGCLKFIISEDTKSKRYKNSISIWRNPLYEKIEFKSNLFKQVKNKKYLDLEFEF